MTAERVRALLASAAGRDVTRSISIRLRTRNALLRRLMPDYEHEAELAALLDRGLLQTTGQTDEAHQMPDG